MSVRGVRVVIGVRVRGVRGERSERERRRFVNSTPGQRSERCEE